MCGVPSITVRVEGRNALDLLNVLNPKYPANPLAFSLAKLNGMCPNESCKTGLVSGSFTVLEEGRVACGCAEGEQSSPRGAREHVAALGAWKAAEEFQCCAVWVPLANTAVILGGCIFCQTFL